MGLAVDVGTLAEMIEDDPEGAEWVRESLAAVNEVLAENRLPLHHEPETLPHLESREAVGSYPYSFLHYLRRFYAHVENDQNWTPAPTPDDEDPSKDPVLDEVASLMKSHLLCHSDCEGFYLPIDFDEVLIDRKDKGRNSGGLLGSSYRLMDELARIAPALGINLEDGQLSDSEADRINLEAEVEEGLFIEKLVWMSLFEASRLSIEHKTAITFG